MIISWASKETEKIYKGLYSRKYPNEIQKKARQKLIMLASATEVEDLRVPPGNRLHKLAGDREGQYSISINDQWRICFLWNESNVKDVEIVDYH